MTRKTILVLATFFSLFLNGQTKKTPLSYEAKVKKYVQWFESLPDYRKREESRILVLKLNSMSSHDRAIWLATSAKYSTKKDTPEEKKVLVDSLTNEGVRKKLLAYVKESWRVDTLIILKSSTAKERTVRSNIETRKKIEECKLTVAESERKLDSLKKIKIDINDYEAYKAHQNIGGYFYDRIETGKNELSYLRKKIITYDSGNFDNNSIWNSYLVDQYDIGIHILLPHKPTDEELDTGRSNGVKFDKEKLFYYVFFRKGYKDGNRWDNYSEFYLEHREASEDE